MSFGKGNGPVRRLLLLMAGQFDAPRLYCSTRVTAVVTRPCLPVAMAIVHVHPAIHSRLFALSIFLVDALPLIKNMPPFNQQHGRTADVGITRAVCLDPQ